MPSVEELFDELVIAIKAESVEDLVSAVEESVDELHNTLWQALAPRHNMEGVINISDELASAKIAPWSRVDAISAIVADFSDYGWTNIFLSLEPAEEYEEDSALGRESIWVATVVRQPTLVIVDGDTTKPEIIEEYGYSKEGALTAAWVRMRDIERQRAN